MDLYSILNLPLKELKQVCIHRSHLGLQNDKVFRKQVVWPIQNYCFLILSTALQLVLVVQLASIAALNQR
jgi:hypothetical protein